MCVSLCVCVCSGNSFSGGSVVITGYQSLPLSPVSSSPYVSPSSTTPPDSPAEFSDGGSNRFQRERMVSGHKSLSALAVTVITLEVAELSDILGWRMAR